MIDNDSGGSMGTITWGNDYRLVGSFTNRADGERRVIAFLRLGQLWRELYRTAGDQARA